MAEKANDHHVAHYERDGSDTNVKDTQAWDDARAANADEHTLTIRDALKQYKVAVMWSLVVSMSIIMEGYDTNLIGNVSQESTVSATLTLSNYTDSFSHSFTPIPVSVAICIPSIEQTLT